MVPTATIEVWCDRAETRVCCIQVYQDTCDVEIHSRSGSVLTLTCSSIASALDWAEQWRPVRLSAGPKAA
jgi:hypothetical protein